MAEQCGVGGPQHPPTLLKGVSSARAHNSRSPFPTQPSLAPRAPHTQCSTPGSSLSYPLLTRTHWWSSPRPSPPLATCVRLASQLCSSLASLVNSCSLKVPSSSRSL